MHFWIAFKKRKSTPSQNTFDAYDEPYPEGDDLFSSKTSSEASPTGNTSNTPSYTGLGVNKQRAADKLFDEQYTFAVDRLSPNPRVKHPLVRANAIRRLLHYSNGSEHLERVVDLLVLWRNAGRRVDDDTVLEIIGIPILLIDLVYTSLSASCTC